MAICGAKKRNGEACQKPPIKGKKRCRLHGGNAGAPTGNKNSAKHNIYSQFMTEDEIEFSQQSELHSIDSELKLCKVQLARALKAKQAQDDAIKDQDKVAIDSMTLGDANPQDQSGGDRIVYKRKDYDALIDRLIGRISMLTKQRNELETQVLTNQKLKLEIEKLKGDEDGIGDDPTPVKVTIQVVDASKSNAEHQSDPECTPS
ncbi:HGGxSTG domain-containing protein [Acinetobacter sp. YH12123]|uniref:HGGxSTG domain-containing protein n=1 Tax=Acinetobacter sp. YH12123 TaxID=2601108 RepID=UPI0015D121C5|nr:HGGxSTG domain-containing protein [Acinetobacter sp. YH12123]